MAGAAPATKTKVSLLLSVETARPGDEITAAIEMRMPPGWHTYWRNGGDVGDATATKIDWELPPGITAGAIQWPVPEKLNDADIITYTYHGTVLLLVPLKVASNLQPGPLELKANVSWIECEKSCLPGEGKVQASFTVGSVGKASAANQRIELAKAALPKTGTQLPVEAVWDAPPDAKERAILIHVETQSKPAIFDFYPDGTSGTKIEGATTSLQIATNKVALRKLVTRDEPTTPWPTELSGLLITGTSGTTNREASEIRLKIKSTADGATSPSGGNLARSGSKSLLPMLGLAFLGGLILNIMPCVLPVIALKILGFVSQSREDPRRVRRLGIIYTLGVLASFLAMAAVVISVKHAGNAASWGMQFQNPQFLIGMTLLVTLVALNLFGVFEVLLGGGAMNAAGSLASKEGDAGAFFNGILATALATPCTAPALSIALGFAFAQSAAVILVTFSAIGLGLAAPYLALCWHPQWLRFLPKPGAWMEQFKKAMGFPMLATAVWLFSITLVHFGKGAAFWLGLFLVLISFAAWVWGEFVQRGNRGRTGARILTILLVLAAYGWVLEGELSWRNPIAPSQNRTGLENRPDGIQWQVWSPEAVDQARKSGRPVLVDFTADWCMTCQVNKKTSLEITSVRDKLKEIDGIALLADYTRKDPAILKELQRHDRAAVPLVLVYPADSGKPAEILPEILTPGLVLTALDRAAGRKK